jgi:hypothetical protein
MPKGGSQWRKSSASETGGCLEVRFAAEEIQVRNSRDPLGPALTFTRREWEAFLAGASAGEFDWPTG